MGVVGRTIGDENCRLVLGERMINSRHKLQLAVCGRKLQVILFIHFLCCLELRHSSHVTNLESTSYYMLYCFLSL